MIAVDDESGVSLAGARWVADGQTRPARFRLTPRPLPLEPDSTKGTASLMPKNRQQIPREQRTAELLAAATELFLRNGYAGTTIADISAAAGVAPANVYWYFPSKDDVFAAVMDRMLTREARSLEHELRGKEPLPILIRGLDDMRAYRDLHRSMHSRLQESTAVREAHDRLLDWIRNNVYRVVDQHPGASDRELVADIVVTLFEGANVSDPPTRSAIAMIPILLEALMGTRSKSA